MFLCRIVPFGVIGVGVVGFGLFVDGAGEARSREGGWEGGSTCGSLNACRSVLFETNQPPLWLERVIGRLHRRR